MPTRIVLIAVIALLLAGGYTAARDTSKDVSVEVLAKTTQSWDGTALPPYPSGNPQVTILRYTIAPFASLPWHEHPVINAGVMIKGRLKVVTEEGESLHLEPGDAIVEVMNKWHHGVNEGAEPAEIIVFYAGIVDTPLAVKKPDQH